MKHRWASNLRGTHGMQHRVDAVGNKGADGEGGLLNTATHAPCRPYSKSKDMTTGWASVWTQGTPHRMDIGKGAFST